MDRVRPRMNAWATLPKLFNFCWTPGGKKPFVSTHRQRQRNFCWHETPGLAWPSKRTWLRAGAGRRRPFNLEQSSNGPQGIHSPAQRNQETPGAFHLPQSFRSSPARQLTCRCRCLRGIPEWRSLWGGLVKVLGVPELVWCGRKRRFRALPGRDSCGASQDDQGRVCLRGQALHGEERGNASDGTKTGLVESALCADGLAGNTCLLESGKIGK